MKRTLLLLALMPGLLLGQSNVPDKSRCHAFIDYQFVWTLEMVTAADGKSVPVVNIVTFAEGEWDLRPNQVHLSANPKKEAEIAKFSIDTGVPGDPYLVQYLKVLGDSFVGMDLEGDFQGFEELSEVAIDLADNRFILQPVDCLEFDSIVAKINQVNFDSPDIRQDYFILEIALMGKREGRRQRY